jgi:multidrug efflux pump
VNPADAPILTIALTSEAYSTRQLSDLVDTQLAQKLSQVSGVGHVSVEGGVRPAVRIKADFVRLNAYGLGLEDLRNAIATANVAGPKGALDGPQQSYTLAANDQITAASAYRDVVIAYRNGGPVTIGAVADVLDGLENDKIGGWFNGKPAVIVDIQRQPGANVVETVGRVTTELNKLEKTFPAGVKLTIVHDRTQTIRASIHDVQFTLIVSVALVVLVVLLFLRTWQATVIAGVALPLSLIATFGIMYFCGFSLDNLSLMALTIGTGFVVDDAIVMIENIHRHIEDGEDPFTAALEGAREIGFTVISLTFSLIAVFIPLLFMTGIVGRMFREFALTLTIAVVTSAIVSLTLSPMMCARLLRRRDTPHATRLSAAGHALDYVLGRYRASLEWVLAHRALMLLVTFGTLAATLYLYVVIPKGFLPPQDTGLLIATTSAEPTVSFAEMTRLQNVLADRVRRDPDVASVISTVGVGAQNATPNAGRIAITLKPRDSRRANAQEIVKRLQADAADVPQIGATFQSVQDIQITTRASRAQYQYTLTGTNQDEVSEWADRLAEELRHSTVLMNVASEAEQGGLRYQLAVDREKAGTLGVTMQAVNDALYDAFGQRQVSTIYAQANQYRVILEASPIYQQNTAALSKLYVGSVYGTQVPLATFTHFENTTAPLSIGHQEQFPAVTVSFDLADGASLSNAVAAVSQAERATEMPGSITGSYSGDAAEFARSLKGEPWLILAAVVTIYIVLGVLYESAIHPITILSTLPSAGVGALLALMFFRMDLSLIALIGIVLLMGIVKKNAIMMIDFALDAERTRGLPPEEAILEASLLRFRPIMMTTLAALFGALPLALGHGTGSELRIPLGITIIGGLLLSQLVTLYTTPVIYLMLERMRHRISGPRPRELLEDEERPIRREAAE